MQSVNHLSKLRLYSHLVKYSSGTRFLQQLRRHYVRTLNSLSDIAPLVTSKKQTTSAQALGSMRGNSSSPIHQTHEPCLQRCMLKSRSIVSVSGPDSDVFLQGLLTNDMTFIAEPRSAMYAALLNVQGRILYDMLVYNISTTEKTYLLECDRQVTADLIKAVSKYKIRKKVVIGDVTDAYDVLAIFPHVTSAVDIQTSSGSSIVNEASPGTEENNKDADIAVIETPDPRVNSLGWRRIERKQALSTAPSSSQDIDSETSEDGYHMTRYHLGIGEGIKDLPPGECFPLESNLVFLGGVCFHKGCYIGQELTARTFHTGVTRKRLMPLIFNREPMALMPGEKILSADGKTVGKYRNHAGKYGLGLLRLAEIRMGHAYNIDNKNAESYELETYVPEWWRKDELSVQSMKQ